jgi:hypothetical protein
MIKKTHEVEYSKITYPELVKELKDFNGGEDQIIESYTKHLQDQYSTQDLEAISEHILAAIPPYKLLIPGIYRTAKNIHEIGNRILYDQSAYFNIMNLASQGSEDQRANAVKTYILTSKDPELTINSFWYFSEKLPDHNNDLAKKELTSRFVNETCDILYKTN